MFTIIAGVIGLGIAVALLIVGANYLGTAYTTSAAKAGATALANFGQQVQGAVQLYRVDNSNANPADLTVLSTGNTTYLANIPVFKYGQTVAPSSINAAADLLTIGDGTRFIPDNVCGQMANVGGVDSTAATLPPTEKFGCVGATAAKNFAYKL